jgi:creatinine amidohydrolase/Fe(II)-dependent formamide hydrolase-like protein
VRRAEAWCGLCGGHHSAMRSEVGAACSDCEWTCAPPYAVVWSLHHAAHTGHACGPVE